MSESDLQFHLDFLRELDDVRRGRYASTHRPGYRVYINTGLQACIEALRANYGTVFRLLGEQSFHSLAGEYALSNPPDDGRLFLYGRGLPESLRKSSGEHSVIAAMAQLDRHRVEALAEFDAPVLQTAWITQQDEASLDALYLRPAPATRWHWNQHYPIWRLWQALSGAEFTGFADEAGAQAVLITRTDDLLHLLEMPPAGVALLDACLDGLPLSQALHAAAHADPRSNLQQLLALLFAAGAFQHPKQFIPRAFI